MKRLTTMTAIALLAGTAAFAQDRASAELNQEVYAMGMAELTGDGYDVDTVQQDRSGTLTFMAANDSMSRVMVMDGDGNVMSDITSDLSAQAAIDGRSNSDDESGSLAAALDLDNSAMLGTESDGDDGGSASLGLSSGADIGISATGSDGDGSGSVGVSVGGGLGIGLGGSN